MLLHLSINAADPEGVAGFLAGLLGGKAMPFPPFAGSWIAFSAADDGTAIEVYPLGHRLRAGPDQIACTPEDADDRPSFVHAAIASPLSEQAIRALAEERGWLNRRCNRGPFECIEVWLENRLLVEVLDAAMLADYRAGMTQDNWAAMFGFERES